MKNFRALRGLKAQIVGLMTLALLPLGLISLYQTGSVVLRAEELARRAIVADTERAVAEERRLLIEAVGSARALGTLIRTAADDAELCDDVMRDFISSRSELIFAGYLPADGVMRCSSSGRVVDFSDYPGFQDLIENPRLSFEVNPKGAVTGKPVLIVSSPVMEGPTFLGYVSISIPHILANEILSEQERADGLTVAVMNRDGDLLSATFDKEDTDHFLPVDLAHESLFARGDETFRATVEDDKARLFAVFTLLEDEIIVVGSWPAKVFGLGQTAGAVVLTMLFPMLMWLAGLVVAYFGLHQLVVRHVNALRDAMRRFALGERSTSSLDLDAPPEELAEAERAFNRMTLILTDAEARREKDLHDKTVLLREVHHRVKNNLQLIASMMNMQARTVTQPETQLVLKSLQRRVQGLASIHRTLYTTPDMTVVDARAMADELVKEITAMSGTLARKLRVERQFEDVMLYPDQAVPLAMLMTEMLTNAVKYAGADADATPWIKVVLKSDRKSPDGLIFSVENSRSDVLNPEVEANSTGLGARLMRAFVMQLDGTFETEETETSYRATVRFNAAQFSDE